MHFAVRGWRRLACVRDRFAMARMTVNELLTAARERLDRVEPLAALAAVEHGAVIIDIRSETQRRNGRCHPWRLVL